MIGCSNVVFEPKTVYIERAFMKKSSPSLDFKSSVVTEQGLIPKTDCTHVTSNLYGSKTHVTFRDHEAEKLADYIAQEEARGALVSTERGVWIV
ncbi:MAG: hypothetical protein H6R18_283 [Proteobacteria bacterium]|nr:hypothetical protein [Pseudomonadota bacterium]